MINQIANHDGGDDVRALLNELIKSENAMATPWPTGTYLLPDHITGFGSSATGTGGLTVFVPVFVPRPTQLASIGIFIATLGDAAARIRCALFSSTDDDNKLPSVLVVDGGEADVGSGSTAVVRDLWTMAASLERGKYWVQFQIKATTTGVTANRISLTNKYVPHTAGLSSGTYRYHTMTHSYGAPVTPHVATLTPSAGTDGLVPYLKAA